MSRREGIGFLGNSVANLVVGAAAMGYAVIVPAVVIRRFGTDLYGTWYLAFQVAAYVLLLDLGSQWVVTKVASTLGRDASAARLTTAAMAAQAGLAVAVIGVAAAWAALTGQGDLTALVLVLGVAAATSLLASTVRAWFAGLRQAHLPALWLVGARLGAVAGLGLALAADAELVSLTLAVALPQVTVNAGLLLWSRRPPSPWARPDREAFTRLHRSTLPLALWTVCGVIVASVDIFVVRAVDPSEVGRYAIALPLLAIPIGVVTAATSAWMPRLAAAEAAGAGGGREPALAGTAVMVGALAAGAVVFVALAGDLVGVWAGGRPGSAATYLRLLYLATALRFAFLPWSVLVLVRGEQRAITPAPVTEALVNLVASVLLGLWLGAIGVALGTLAGSIVAAGIYLGWAVPRTAGSGVTTNGLLHAARSAWPPVAAAAAAILVGTTGAPAVVRVLTGLAALAVGGWWLAGQGRRPAEVVGPDRSANTDPSVTIA